MSTNTYEISDKQWERIKDMLPPERTCKPGRPCSTPNRDVLNGALWIAHTGCQWKELQFTNVSSHGKTMVFWN